MSYLTKQDLLDELGERKLAQLTNDSGNTVNDTRVAAVIENAKGVFESYIRNRYTLPVPCTALVKSLNTKLAIFELIGNRSTFDEGVYKVRQDAYKEAMAQLKDISTGKAALDVPAIEETKENPATGDKILTNAGRSKFNDTTLGSF